MKKNFAIALGMFFAVSMTLSAQGGLTTTQTVNMTVQGKALIEALLGASPRGITIRKILTHLSENDLMITE